MMTPWDLIVWAGAFAVAVIAVAFAFGIAVAIVKAARGKKEVK